MNLIRKLFQVVRRQVIVLPTTFNRIHLKFKYLFWGCLVVLGLLLATLYTYLTTPIFPPREFRGVWVASVDNVDWPSQPNLSVAQQQAELLNILNRMQDLNLNALILQVRPTGDALYDSAIEPWSSWLTGTQGTPPDPYYDPLEFAITESHKRNIELHAWFNPYRAQLRSDEGLFASNHMAVQYPQYAYQYGQKIWMDLGAQVIQDQTFNVIMDVVRRYDIDGVHLDDYFYPYPQRNTDFPDDRTYNAYKRSGGTLSLADWRRQNVNTIIQRLYQGIHAEKPKVKFGISPFGIYRPGNPPGIEGFDQYEGLYADVKLWLERGWLDYLAPQLYWQIDPPQQSYPALLNWWLQQNPKHRHIYAGIALSRLRRGWPSSEYVRQVSISRHRKGFLWWQQNKLSLGNIFFSMKIFCDNVSGVNDVFKQSVYPTPALPPTMPWLDHYPPSPPIDVTVKSGVISWNLDQSGDVFSWALYRRTGRHWTLAKVFNKTTTTTKVTPGNYALRAVDRLANESQKWVITVP